jgi:hypothetical protein
MSRQSSLPPCYDQCKDVGENSRHYAVFSIVLLHSISQAGVGVERNFNLKYVVYEFRTSYKVRIIIFRYKGKAIPVTGRGGP